MLLNRDVPLWRRFSLVIYSSSKAPCQKSNCNKQHQNKAGQSDNDDNVDTEKTCKTYKKAKENGIVVSLTGLRQARKCSGKKFLIKEN